MPSPRVSVIMLTLNRAELIGRAIDSVEAQEYQDWELLVVHDGDNEQTASLVHQREQDDERVRYLPRRTVGNIAEATNFGLRRARGELIAILDDDDAWADTAKLAKQVRFLDEHPDYVVCGGGVIAVDAGDRETLRYHRPESDVDIRKRILFANPMAHSTTLYRKEAAIKIGLYDETLAGFQDWDVWLKLGHIGKLYNFQEYFLRYTIWESGGSFTQQRKNTRSALTIVHRHRHYYRGYALALGMNLLYHAYGYFPLSLRRATFAPLSRFKKAIFSR